jgi:hypothetical protein
MPSHTSPPVLTTCPQCSAQTGCAGSRLARMPWRAPGTAPLTGGPCGTIGWDGAVGRNVRCAFFGRNPQPRVPLVPTPARLHLCDQWHSYRVLTPLTSWHGKFRPNTEGIDQKWHGFAAKHAAASLAHRRGGEGGMGARREPRWWVQLSVVQGGHAAHRALLSADTAPVCGKHV